MERSCHSCKRQGVESTGVKWCSDCAEDLCNTCVKFHIANKSSKDHYITPGGFTELVEESELVCHDHNNKELEAYCYDHQHPCCIVCSTEIHRKCSSVIVLDKCAKDVRSSEEFSGLWKLLKDLESDLGRKYSTGTDLKEDLQKLTEKVKDAKESMSAKIGEFDNIIAALERKESELDERIDSVEKVQIPVLHCIHAFEKSMNYAPEASVFLKIKKMNTIAQDARTSYKALDQFDSFKIDLRFETALKDLNVNIEKFFNFASEVLPMVSEDENEVDETHM